MGSGNIRNDRHEMCEHQCHLALEIFVNVFIRSQPLLARLHEIHSAVLGEESDIRVGIGCTRREATEEGKPILVRLCSRHAKDVCGELVAVSVEPGWFQSRASQRLDNSEGCKCCWQAVSADIFPSHGSVIRTGLLQFTCESHPEISFLFRRI